MQVHYRLIDSVYKKCILENDWAVFTFQPSLTPTSHVLWMEFVGFKYLVEVKMLKTVDRFLDRQNLIVWLQTEMEQLDLKTKHCLRTLVTHHYFDNEPNLDWLHWQSQRLNQSVLLAIALPPVTLDMSTHEDVYYRAPLTSAQFPRFRSTVSIRDTKVHGSMHRAYYTRSYEIETGSLVEAEP